MKLMKTAFTAGVALAAMTSMATAEDLTIGMASEVTAMDPHFHNLGPNNEVARHIFDNLINQNELQQLKPGLAVSWGPVDDLTWEFKLREGVKFHDGSDFNADDVICSFERAPNVPNSPSSFSIALKGKTFEKVDDFTLHVKTPEPYPLMANDLSIVAIVSSETGCNATTEQFNSGEAAQGTGPWKFVSYTPGDAIVMERNDAYFGDAPEFSNLTLKPIKSGPARVAALLAGDVDMIASVPTTDLAQLKKNPDLQISEGVSNRVIYLHLDQFREDSPFVTAKDGSPIKNPLMDVNVRKAISKAISRDAIVERVMEGQAIPAGQLLPDGFFGVSDKLEPEAYDPEAAKAMIAEAGYPDGFKLRIHGPNDRYINDAKIVEAIAQMLTRIGVETDVETMPRSTYFGRASRGAEGDLPEFSFILVGWGAGSGEASSPLRSLVHTFNAEAGFGASNRGRFSNADIDAKIEEALRTVDDAGRAAALAEATEMSIGGEQAIIPLHYQVNAWAARKGLAYKARTDEYTLAQGVTKDQ